jgi:hypothetical protein
MHDTFKPYDLATIATPNSGRRRVVEIISRPFLATYFDTNTEFPTDPPVEITKNRIKIRWVPGEPTTLGEAVVADLEPWKGTRAEGRYLHVARVFSTFHFPPDMLRYDNAYLFDHEVHEEGPVHEPPLDPEDRRGLRVPEEGILVYQVRRFKNHGEGSGAWMHARWQSFSCRVEPVLVRDLRDPEAKIVWRAKK